MSVIQIREAQREGARLFIALAGISGSGKTYSALQLAYGLAGYDASKVGLLDTENRRGSLYADILRDKGGKIQRFLIGDLFAPFSPQRYVDAIQEFQKAGVRVLVIDSVTHEWEGTGGCEEIATAGDPKTPRWNTAKREHKRFMNAALQCDMHVIACVRAREKVKLVKGANGKAEYEPLGIMPVQEKNFMFECTASLLMWDSGRSQQVLKCPEELRGILGREKGYITAADGAALLAWVNGGQQLDPRVEAFRNRLQSVTEKGRAFIEAAWAKVPGAIQAALGEDFRQQLLAAASAFDQQTAAAAAVQGENVDDLNAALAGGAPNGGQEGP